jgi:hypothetical protein
MAIEIINTGGYISTDKNGFLLPRVDRDSIHKKWRPAVDDFLVFIQDFCKESVHSIYLRGSVAAGCAIEGISDVDFFLVVNSALIDAEKKKIYKQADQINQRYPFITRFDVGFYTQDEILRKSERALIKLTSVCLYGENITECIKDLKPGKDVAVQIPTLEAEIRETANEIMLGKYNKETARIMCVWMMKRIVRSGFELTSARTQNFTRDLYKCWENFSYFYPEKREEMYEALNLAINPTHDTGKILKVMKGLGLWVIGEAKKEALL